MASKKSLIKEFREFIAQGDVMDMAVGIIIGAALTSVVTALVTNIIQPFITLITGGNGTNIGGLAIPVTDTQSIDFGAFISAIINFVIIAACVFLLVKCYNKMKRRTIAKPKRNEAGQVIIEVEPDCPFCLETVNVGATKCFHCGSELPEPAKIREEIEE